MQSENRNKAVFFSGSDDITRQSYRVDLCYSYRSYSTSYSHLLRRQSVYGARDDHHHCKQHLFGCPCHFSVSVKEEDSNLRLFTFVGH